MEDRLQVRRGSHSPRERIDATALSHHATGHLSQTADETATGTKKRTTFADLNLHGANVLGQRLSIFWEGTDEGDMWYPGRVVEYNHSKKEYLVEYDDGDTDWYDLLKIKYQILPPEKEDNNNNTDSSEQPKRRKTFTSMGISGVNLLGKSLEIYWSDPENGDAWYAGTIQEYRISDKKHFILFDDGDSDWYDLEDIKYRVPNEEEEASSGSNAALPEGHTHHTAHGHTSNWNTADKKLATIHELKKPGKLAIELKVAIFWQDDEIEGGGQWYNGTINDYKTDNNTHHVLYDDGDREWYDLSSIKHRVLTTKSIEMKSDEPDAKSTPKKKSNQKKKQKMNFSAIQPAESKKRTEEWLLDLKKRRALAHKNGTDLGYEVVGELSVGGVVALRTVHEAMLQERYISKTAQERLDEYWKLQLHARFGLQHSSDEIKLKKMNVKNIATMKEEILHATGYVLPPTRDSSSANHDRFHELARAHGDLHLDEFKLPGQVGDDNDVDHEHENDLISLQVDARKSALNSHTKVPKTIVVKMDPSSPLVAEKTENDLLSGAEVPLPPAPHVKASLDVLLHKMIEGEIDEGEKHPEEYITEFLKAVPEKEIVVGGISLRDIQLQERKIEMERLDTMRREVMRYRRREEALMVQEERARVRILTEADQKSNALDTKHHANVIQIRKLERKMRRSFLRKEDQLIQNLEDQRGIVKKRIGTLQVREDTDTLTYNNFNVRWDRVPQPVALDIRLMRAVRDRLPNGRYVFLVTLYDRMGGSPLFWSAAGLNGSTVGLPGATDPIRHKGRYYDLDTHVHKTAYTVCPAKRDVKPTLTYVIEVFQLGTGKWPDRVVAWTVLPAVDIGSEYTVGKFRLPLLRGPVDPTLDLYSRFESAYTSDLDRWLCNVYIEIRLESKETLTGDGTVLLRNQEIVMDYTTQLLQVKKDEYLDRTPDLEDEKEDDGRLRPSTMNDEDHAHTTEEHRNKSSSNTKNKNDDFGGYKAPKTVQQQRLKHQRTAVKLGMKGYKNGVKNDDPTTRNVSDDLNVGLSDFQKGEQLAMKTDLQSLSKYNTAVMQRGSPSFTNASEGARRLMFLYHEIADEYKVRRWATIDFWVSFMILLVGFWVRLYVHFLGLYLYLRIIGIKNIVFGSPIEPLQILTKYNQNLPVHYELGAAISGQCFNICIFACFMTINYCWRKIFGRLPDIMSKWMMGFGVGVVLDAVFVFIVDMAYGNYNCETTTFCKSSYMSQSCRCMTGDAFKLPEKFRALEGSSAPGWILIAVAYTILFVISSVLFYNYLLLQHFNGRVWDLYWRLSALEQDIFVPEDLELSTSELRWVCSKAARWRGPKGDKRKVKVKQYIYSDPMNMDQKETTTHLAIYHEDSKGERTLYRHFLRSPDGTLLEVFGDLVADYQGEYLALEKALLNAADQVEESKKFR